MLVGIRGIFGPDQERYEGVPRINIYLLRLMFVLMFLMLGRQVWTYILTHQGPWGSDEAVAYSVFASFSMLALLGIVRPLKMLPLVMLEIAYKVMWLMLVAYPLWSTNWLQLAPGRDNGNRYHLTGWDVHPGSTPYLTTTIDESNFSESMNVTLDLDHTPGTG